MAAPFMIYNNVFDSVQDSPLVLRLIFFLSFSFYEELAQQDDDENLREENDD